MATIGILTLFFLGICLGVWGGIEHMRLNQPDREKALRKQVHALQTALEISRHAWSARSAMHTEADRIRREERSA